MARRVGFTVPLIALLLAGCTDREAKTPAASPPAATSQPTESPASKPAAEPDTTPAKAPPPAQGEALATFGGGCFWCMEPPYEGRPGIKSVISGYSGGPEQNPTYKQVSRGKTGHTEVVQITFDPSQISYGELVEIFWKSMNPTDLGGQFNDRGTQYRPEIFVHDAEQRKVAEASKTKLMDSGKFADAIVVPVTDFTSFWPAEEYHQDYYKKNSSHYKRYRKGSGREGFLRKVWGDDAAGEASR